VTHDYRANAIAWRRLSGHMRFDVHRGICRRRMRLAALRWRVQRESGVVQYRLRQEIRWLEAEMCTEWEKEQLSEMI